MLISPHLSSSFYPCLIDSDGNCMFRAVSMSLWGVETYHEELRARTIIEMIVNADKYLDSDLLNSMLENPIYEVENNGDHPDLITFLANMTSSSKDITGNGKVLCQEIVRLSILSQSGSCWHLFAMSNALKIKIHQFYPNINARMDTVPFKVLTGKINGAINLDQSNILTWL